MSVRRMGAALIALAVAISLGLGQSGEPGPVGLAVATNTDWGTYLTSSDGHSLYLYVKDTFGASACTDACLDTWPPFLVPEGASAFAGEGVDPGLINTLTRSAGAVQVMYNGWPLYFNARDSEAGSIRGQALGAQFYLVSPGGAAITHRSEAAAVTVSSEELETLMAEGKRVFDTHCQACHGKEGQGVVGPRLADNPTLAGVEHVVTRILDGYIDHGMPPFGPILNDRQIAATATYVRNSWGNEFGPVVEEEVASFR